MKVGSRLRAEVLLLLRIIVLATAASKNLKHFLVVDSERHLRRSRKHLLFFFGPEVAYTLHLVNTDEVGHAGVHLLAVEQVHGEVVLGAHRRARGLVCHVVHVDDTVANLC